MEMERTKMRSYFVLAIALGSFVIGSACQKASTAPVAPPAVHALTVVPAMQEATAQALKFSGVIEPYRRVDLAFRVNGYVESIRQERGSDGRLRALEPGDFVHKGTVLASLRRADYRARVEQSSGLVAEANAAEQQARAQLAQTEAQFEQAARDWKRAQVLFTAAAMTKPDYDAAQARYQALEAQRTAAQNAIAAQQARRIQASADLSAAQVSLDDTQMHSPFDAVVLTRSIEVGMLAAPGTLGFSLAEISLVKTVFGVPDVDLAQVRQGAHLAVSTDAFPGECFTGIVTSISPGADDRSRTYNVQLTVANQQLRLKPGMVSSVSLAELRGRASNLLLVPLTALVRVGDHDSSFGIYRILQNGDRHFIHLRPVELGAIHGNQMAIAKGLSPGDQIVESGGSQLSDGQAVNLTN
jgi:membrane fusion protein, multidrug efflux system